MPQLCGAAVIVHAVGVRYALTEYRRFNRWYSTNCTHKPATGSFVAAMTLSSA